MASVLCGSVLLEWPAVCMLLIGCAVDDCVGVLVCNWWHREGGCMVWGCPYRLLVGVIPALFCDLFSRFPCTTAARIFSM